jgi:hypothetical protein
MATRLYFGPAAPPVSPSFDASWEATGSAVRRLLEDSKGNSGDAFESLAVATSLNSPAGAVDVLIAQYVSPPLSGDQTISGTVKGQVRAQTSSTAGKLVAQVLIWVRKADGTSRGTLLAHQTTDASEFAASLTNRKFPQNSPASLSSVAALDTDRIVVEIGYRKFENATTSRTGTLRLGNPSGSDLAEDETTTTDNVPWIEFSQSLTFAATSARVTQLAVESLETTTSLARVTQLAVESLETTTSLARVTQLAVEVLRSSAQDVAHGAAEPIWVGGPD